MTAWRERFEPWITPLFRTWWRLRRPMTLGVRALITDADGAVLLVRHTYVKGWHFPGGGVEQGETARDAVIRETAEEGGAEATSTPILIGLYANHANFPNDHIALYRIDAWRPCPPRSQNEIAQRAFFQPDALPPNVTPATRRRIAELFQGAEPSADW